jgi:RimJ/RimL family protein N-acetyltransferase
MTETLDTARLTLRRFADTEADAALLFELDSDPEVMRYIGPFALPTVAAYREHIRNRFLRFCVPGTPRGVWAAHEKPAGEFIGWFFLRPAPEYKFAVEAGWNRATDLEIGYRFRRAAWGRGLATEGASFLVGLGLADPAVTSVVGATLVTNRASCRVLEKCGLVRQREFAIPGFADLSVTFARYRDGVVNSGS